MRTDSCFAKAKRAAAGRPKFAWYWDGKGREIPALSAKPILDAACAGRASDQEIVFLGLVALGGGNHPERHAAPAGPGILRVLGIAILRCHRALTLAALAKYF